MPVRVLIAEEQKECCQLFRQYLQRCGFEVATVHDGMGCIEALHDGASPDVLILSWELPWGEGEGVLDWLKDQRMADIAVVVLTARIDPDAHQQEMAVPRVTWVQRPFRLVELLLAVQSTERVPRHSWRCLETLWRTTTQPVNGVLVESAAETKDPVASNGDSLSKPDQAGSLALTRHNPAHVARDGCRVLTDRLRTAAPNRCAQNITVAVIGRSVVNAARPPATAVAAQQPGAIQAVAWTPLIAAARSPSAATPGPFAAAHNQPAARHSLPAVMVWPESLRHRLVPCWFQFRLSPDAEEC